MKINEAHKYSEWAKSGGVEYQSRWYKRS